MWEYLTVVVEITDSGNSQANSEIGIPGIENFEIFSSSQGSNFQSINGEITSSMRHTLDLRPKSKWEFTLGPVSISWSGILIQDDETVSIIVGDPFLPYQWGLKEDIVQTENPSPLKPVREVWFPYLFLFSSLVLFFIVFYLILRHVLSKEEKDVISTATKMSEKEHRGDTLQKYFKALQKDLKDASSQEFFRRYNTGLREYLMNSWYLSAKTDTLEELRRHSDIEKNVVYQILEKTYKYEFNNKTVRKDTRQRYMNEILEIL